MHIHNKVPCACKWYLFWVSFQSSRGLRQGDHLSSYLFVLAEEVLSCLLESAKEVGYLLGFRVERGGKKVEISHLFFYFLFVDDTLFSCDDS